MAKKSGTNIQRTPEGIIVSTAAAYLPGAKAAVTFAKDFFYQGRNILPRQLSKGDKSINFIPWGDDNLYPQHVIEVTEKNPVALSLIDFKNDLAFGSGIKLGHYVDGKLVEYKPEEIEADPKLREVNEWIADNNLNAEIAEICMDEIWWDQSDVELILSKDRKKIAQVSCKDKVFSRWSEMNAQGHIEYHLYCAKWAEGATDKNTIVTPVLDFKKPGLDLKIKLGIKPKPDGSLNDPLKSAPSYIYPIRIASPGRKYYPFATWHSIINSGWLDFANAIPVFKKSLMTNSIVVKYHVEINKDYFINIFAQEGINKKEEMMARQKREYNEIQDFLTGAENTGKPWISYFKMTPDGKVDIPDIKITKIDTKIGGEYLEDSQEASAMIYNAFSVHPNLHGVIPSKSGGSLSGSDKRELLRIAQTLQARRRQKKLDLIKLIKDINGWPVDLVVYISDNILTTLDQGKEVQTIDSNAV